MADIILRLFVLACLGYLEFIMVSLSMDALVVVLRIFHEKNILPKLSLNVKIGIAIVIFAVFFILMNVILYFILTSNHFDL